MKYALLHSAIILATAFGVAACRDKAPVDDQQAHIAEVVAAGGSVDSILPIAVQLERFRADITDRPDTLRHSSPSVRALVTRWTLAVARNDTIELNDMLLDRAEFAWLYYPGSKMSLPPYEAPPQLLWGQMLETSEEGARKLLQAFADASFRVGQVRCPTAPTIEGANRLHEGCLVQIETVGARAVEGTLFGTILERDGRFKFVSYASRR